MYWLTGGGGTSARLVPERHNITPAKRITQTLAFIISLLASSVLQFIMSWFYF
jgi:hypothetical protein